MNENEPNPELIISLPKVLDYLPAMTSTTRCRRTVYNWADRGIPNYSGELVKLKTERNGSRRFTRYCWLKQFLEELEK